MLGSDRGTSLIRIRPTLGPYSTPTPRALWWSSGGRRFLASEVPLYTMYRFPKVAYPAPFRRDTASCFADLTST